MKTSQSSRLLAILLAMIVAVGSYAQEVEEDGAPAAPDFNSLQSNWWPYFEGSGEVVEPRASEFLDLVEIQVADLAAQNQEIAASVLDAVRANITAYLALLDDTELTPQELPPPAVNYSIDELLDLASASRDAQSNAAEEQLEVEREQRVFDGATRRRDAAFRDYDDAAAGDEQWLAALRLLQSRSAQEISSRRLELLSQRFDRATEFAESAIVLVDLAVDLLAPTTNSTELNERVSADESAVDAAASELRAAQLAASGLDVNTAQGRSQQRLQQQRLLEAEVRLGISEIALASSEAKYWWTLLELDSVPDISEIEDRAADDVSFENVFPAVQLSDSPFKILPDSAIEIWSLGCHVRE